MGLSFKMAWRNLWRHKGKSLVVGAILFLGSFLMTVGNGMVSGMERGLTENIVNLFTGDLVVISDQQEKDDVLFDMMSGKPLKVIKNYQNVNQVLKSATQIERFLPSTAGVVYVLNKGSEMGNIMLLGVDITQYRKMFPGSFSVTEGRLLRPAEKGVLVSEESRKQAFDNMDMWVIPVEGNLVKRKLPPEALKVMSSIDFRRDLVFMGASTSNSSMDIRVPVTGIIKYKSLNKVWGLYCIVDIESFREAHNYVTGADSQVELSGEKKELFKSDTLDQMFSSTNLVEERPTTTAVDASATRQTDSGKDKKIRSADLGSYNLVFIKLKPGSSPKAALKSLNAAFKQNRLNVRAVSWKDAVGTIGSMAVMIKGALNLFIMLIFFVAIIVIMNTLSMAALERVAEIGMMRAVGARKGFLRKMFVYETGVLACFFGGLGIIGGIIIIYILKAMGIVTTNEFLQLVYGGDRLNPIFSLADFLLGVAELGFVTLLAVLYPLRVVGKITPLDAIARD